MRPQLLCSYGGEASAPLLLWRRGLCSSAPMELRPLLLCSVEERPQLLCSVEETPASCSTFIPPHEQCLDFHYHSFNVVFIDKNAAFIKNKDISKCSQTFERQSGSRISHISYIHSITSSCFRAHHTSSISLTPGGEEVHAVTTWNAHTHRTSSVNGLLQSGTGL